jgi:xanthine dehydrogenase accessory factor
MELIDNFTPASRAYFKEVSRAPFYLEPTAIDRPAILGAAEWARAGKAICLVTLVNVEGSSARTVGAQMTVNEDGESLGYLTGGCLEREFVLVALKCIREGRSRLERYGKGSRYIDLRLPCGSGIDVLFDPCITLDVLTAAASNLMNRVPFELLTELDNGVSVALPLQAYTGAKQQPLVGFSFARLFLPTVRVNIFGDGYAPLQLAMLLDTIGMSYRFHTDDEFTAMKAEERGVEVYSTQSLETKHSDCWTATAVLFHAHERDVAVLRRVLGGPCFYVGAVGGRIAAANRAEQLSLQGVTAENLALLTAPAGLVRGARTASELASGILAEILDAARRTALVS